MRFELTTLTLARLCSTPELRPLPYIVRKYKYNRKAASGKWHSLVNNLHRPTASELPKRGKDYTYCLLEAKC